VFLRITNYIKNNSKELLVSFCLVYFSNDTLLFGTNQNKVFFWIHIIVLCLVLVFLFLKNKTIHNEYIPLLFVTILLNLLTIVINYDLSIKYLFELMMLFIGIFVSQSFSKEKFFNCFCFWIKTICLFSIGAFITALIFPSIINALPTITNKNGNIYHFALFTFIEPVGYSVLPRVYGIFREPGVFMIFIGMAMIFELLFKDKIQIKSFIIYVIAMLSIFSTAGYISLALILVLAFLKILLSKNIADKKRNIFAMLLVLVALGLFIAYFGFDRLNSFVFNKLRVENASSTSRFGSFAGNLRMFFENPIIGKGYSFAENNFTLYASYSGYSNAHNTNTFLKILSVHGIIYFAFITIAIFKFFSFSKNKLLSLMMFGIFILMLCNEDLIVNTIIYVIAIFGLANQRREYENSINKRSSLWQYS